ncbi:MAG: winged helix-turn-helix transcriptional regulator [Treponema sp.]|nr:winged helix-turn-helix transcriptional regulator [Treponema sp.]
MENPELLIKTFWDTVNNQNKVSINLLLNKHVYTKEIEGKSVIFIEVPRAERQFRPVFIDKDVFSGTYHRNGEGDYHCTKEDISEMFRDASVASADTKVLTEMDESVFCMESIKGYRNIFRTLHVNHVWDSLDDIDFLRKIGAVGLSTETGKLHPTAAGLLMFGYEYEIVREFPQYFLDYQEKFDSKIRWSDRVVSSSGEWSGNVFDFFFKAATKLASDIKRPFKLDGIFRVDDTPVHKAVREALVNTLVNADYYGRQGIVIQKYPEKFVFENPGSFRIPLQDAFDGGTSDPRNVTILKMFSMIDIGERAGSGIPGIVSVWEENFKSGPVYVQTSNPSRVKTVLDISSLVNGDVIPSDKDEFQAINEVSSDKSSDNTDFHAINQISSDKSNQKQENVEKELLTILADKQEHSVSELAKVVGLSPARTRAITAELVSKGLISAIGANRNRTYRLADKK